MTTMTAIVFIDYETFWHKKDFNLKYIPYEAYVRDPRFEPQLLSVAVDDGPVYKFEPHQIKAALDALPLERPDVWTVAHNMKFDGFITTQYYGKYITNPLCTQVMSRWTGPSRIYSEKLVDLAEFFGLPPKGHYTEETNGKHYWEYTPEQWAAFKEYGGRDVEILRWIFKLMLPHCTQDALDFAAMTDSMYINPILQLDQNLLTWYDQELVRRFEQARQDIMHIFRFDSMEEFKKHLKSPAKFSSLLEQLGVATPMKLSAKQTKTARAKAKKRCDDLTKKYWSLPIEVGHVVKQHYLEEIYKAEQAIDEEVYIPALSAKDLDFIALQDDPDPRVATLCTIKAQNNSDMHVTRCKTFLNISRRGTLPVPLESFRAWTGRYTAGSDDVSVKSDAINMQNLNKRKGDKTIRKAIIAPAGYTLVAGDSAQVEARVGAWIACETQLVDGFARGDDVYCDLAGTIYGLDPQEIRYWAKGEGAKKNLDAVKIKLADKQRFIGKTGILSSQYQISGATFSLRLLQDRIWLGEKGDREFHDAEGIRINQVYRGKYRRIVAFWKRCEGIISCLARGERGYFGGPDDNTFYYDGAHEVFGRKVPGIMFPDGFWLLYPNLRYEFDKEKEEYGWRYDQIAKGKKIWKYLYGGQLFNNLTQGLSSAALRWQALGLRREGIPINMNVHDEWLSVVLDQYVEYVKSRYAYWLKTAPPWCRGVPFDCEIGAAKNYGGIE